MENLRKLRQAAKLSTYKLAEELKLTNATICNYENNKREPDIKTIIQLADFFNVTTDYLLEYEEKRKQEETEQNNQGRTKRYITVEEDDILNLFNELNKKYGKEFSENIIESLWKLINTNIQGKN